MKKSAKTKRNQFKYSETARWFAALDRLNTEPFMPDGRNQPKTPRRRIFR